MEFTSRKVLIRLNINTNGINVDDEAEVDHTLAQANIFASDSPPELLGGDRVGLPQFMLYAQRGWHLAKCEAEGTAPG